MKQSRGGSEVQTITSKWVQGLQFVARGDSGHAIVLDVAPSVGGLDSGNRPGELTLMALGTCTGIDVASILKKMRVEFESFEIEVRGEAAPEHPKVWTEVWVRYRIKGDIPEDKLKKAIELSRDRYCSVGALFKKAVEVHYDYEILKE
jgi:putative redox protein